MVYAWPHAVSIRKKLLFGGEVLTGQDVADGADQCPHVPSDVPYDSKYGAHDGYD